MRERREREGERKGKLRLCRCKEGNCMRRKRDCQWEALGETDEVKMERGSNAWEIEGKNL